MKRLSVIFSIAMVLAGCEKSDAEKQKPYIEAVLELVKDPGSAQFRKLRLVTGKGGEALCGQINSKNSYGAYTGFTEFVSATLPLPKSQKKVIIAEEGILMYLSAEDRIAAGCW